MKSQALFSSKDKSKKLKCCLLQFLFGTFRVNIMFPSFHVYCYFLLSLYSVELPLLCKKTLRCGKTTSVSISWLWSGFVVAVLLFYIHGKHLRSCRDSQLT